MDSRSPIPAIPAIPAIPPTTYQNLMNDVTVVKKYVHDRTDEEIFAYLEAHYNDFNRIERVVHELVGRNDIFIEENEIDKEENHKLEQIDLNNEQVQRLLGIKQCCWTQSCTCWTPRGNNGALPLIRRENSSISDENYKSYHDEQLKTLMEILPDGDSSFFSNFIRMNRGNETFINESVNLWLQKGNYKRRVEIQSEGVKKNRFVEGNMSVEEFLDIFPDPETFFDKARNTDVNKNYKHHVLIYTSNNYSLCDSYLVQIILKHKYRLIPVVEEMKCYEPAMKRIKKELREMPKEIDELFYQELTYLKLIDEIKGYRQRKDEEKRKRLEEAKSNGTLMTCECCFEEELLLDDMLPCPKDHLFCKICICRQAEINIGANKLQFPCFNGYCKEDFSMTVLQKCLKPNVFSIILRKVQEEEIRRAQIADLESCPFCSFSAIMPDPNDKVFKCLNPECLKSSCRLCKELNHVPLRCNEVEKKPEVDMRTFIENKMSDALMRTCPKCKCRLIKYEGCNRMTCTCGQMMCYLCRQPIDGYSHFESFGNSNSKCPITSNVFDLHQKELKSSAEAARREYIRLHPEVASMELKHDPIKHISNERRLNLTKMTEFPVRRFDFTKIPIDSRVNQPQTPYRVLPFKQELQQLTRATNQQYHKPPFVYTIPDRPHTNMLPPSSTTNNSNQFNPPSFNTFTNTDLPLPVPPPPPYTNLTGNYPSNNTNLTGIYPTNNTNLTGNYPANNTNLTGNYPTNNTNLTGNYRTNNANLMRNYPSNNTNLSATYLLDNTHGKRNFTLNMNIKQSITHVTNNTHSTRNYPSTATCPSVMPLDDFPRMQNGAYVTQPSTSQIGNIKLQNPVFSGKLVGGKDDPNQSFISSTNQGSGNFSFRQNENQSPSFPLLTSLLSPGASTSSPNGGRSYDNFLF